MFTNLLINPDQWLTYSDLVAGFTESYQSISQNSYLNTIDRDVCEIRGNVNLSALYRWNISFEAAISGVDPDGLNQEDFRRMILLNRIQVRATVFDERRGRSRQVGRAALLASDLDQFQIRFRISHLPAQVPIRVEVLFGKEPENHRFPLRFWQIPAAGWSGEAILNPGEPLLEANFALR